MKAPRNPLGLVVLLFGLSAHADLVRMTHYPAAMHATQGNHFTDWKITTATANRSPWASGVVVAVKDGIRAKGTESNDTLSYVYANGTTYKAVYILTCAHVLYNDRAELSNAAPGMNPDSRLYTMMLATPIQIFDRAGKLVFSNTYFLDQYPINIWNGQKYEFWSGYMGYQELVYGWQPRANYDRYERLGFYWGTDFALLRLIVPSYVPVEAEKIGGEVSRRNDLDVWFNADSHSRSYEVKERYGRNSSAFVADLKDRDYVAQPGWSGSPILDKSSHELLGIVASAWPGASSALGAYSIGYVMDMLGAWSAIEADFRALSNGWSRGSGPLKGNFYGAQESAYH